MDGTQEPYDAVVVGAGIGGTTFALAAARNGWNVALVERARAPPRLLRPEMLWQPTMATFDRLGVGERVRREAALELEAVQLWDAREGVPLVRLDRGTLERAQARPHATDPEATRRVLLEEALATGQVTHLPSLRVTGLARADARVEGVQAVDEGGEEVTVHAPFVVGDDGDRSAVRESAGIRLQTRAFPVEFILTQAPRPPGLPVGHARAFIDPRGFGRGLGGAFLVPVARDRVAVVLLARRGTFEAHEDRPPEAFLDLVAPVLLPHLDVALSPRFPEGYARAVRPVGHADATTKPGVALVGDAAHPVSPVGGQGANMSVADAEALARHVLLSTRPGQSPNPDALARYETERRPADQRSVTLSRRAVPVMEALWRAPWLARALPPLMRAFDSSDGRKERALHALSHAFVAEGAPDGAREGPERGKS